MFEYPNNRLEYLKHYEPLIYSKILIHRYSQGNMDPPSDAMCLDWDKNLGNFNWKDTVEGEIFWSAINRGDYDVYYREYPIYAGIPNIDNYSII